MQLIISLNFYYSNSIKSSRFLYQLSYLIFLFPIFRHTMPNNLGLEEFKNLINFEMYIEYYKKTIFNSF